MRLPILTAAIGAASLLCFLACSEAASIEGKVLGVTFRGVTRGVSTKTKVVLSGGRYQTHVQGDGTFAFPDVPIGTYLLEVHSPYLTYSKVRIAVTANEVKATQVSLGDHFSGNQKLLPLPLILRPRPRPMHYIPPEGAKVAGWFANPMILMSSFSLLMLLLMPKIVANLDEDALHALRASYDFGCLPSLTSQHHTGPVMPHPFPAPSHHTMSNNLYNAGTQTSGHATFDVAGGPENFYSTQQQVAPPVQSKKQK